MAKQHKTIYDILAGYKKEDIDKAIAELSDTEKSLIKLRYGNDLSNPDINLKLNAEQSAEFYRHLIPKLKAALKRMNKKLKTIYEYFPEHTKEQVDKAIEHLHPEAKNLLYLRYGEHLDQTKKSPNWTNEMTIQFHNQVIKFIQNYLNSRVYAVTIYDYFEGYTKEKVNALLMELTFEEKYLLYLKYGKNLQNPKKSLKWNEALTRAFAALVRKLKARIKKENDLIEALCFEEDKDWQKIVFICEGENAKKTMPIDSIVIESMNYLNNSFYYTDIFQSIIPVLKEQDAIIVSLKYKENKNIEEIAELIGVSPLEVIASLKRTLVAYELAIFKLSNPEIDEPGAKRN